MDIEVGCINKTPREDPHLRIENIGGVSGGEAWKMSVDEGIAAIEAGKYRFYVNKGSNLVRVVVAEHEGHKYLKTEADDLHPNNLLSLPECP